MRVRLMIGLLALVLAACGGDAGGPGSSTTLAGVGESTTMPGGTTATTTGSTGTTVGGSTGTTASGPGATTTPGGPASTTTTAPGPQAGVIPPPDRNNPLEIVAYVFDSMTTYDEKLPYMVGFEGMEQAVLDWWAFGLLYGPEGTRFLVDLWPDTQSHQTEVRVRFQYAGLAPSTPFTVAYNIENGEVKIYKSTFCSVITSQGVTCPD